VDASPAQPAGRLDRTQELEAEIASCLSSGSPASDEDQRLRCGAPPAFHAMLRYPFGWTDEQLRPVRAPTGKRLRPTLCLLCCEAAGADYHIALPAAAAVEIIHSFSLVHDDVQDRSPERRHRPSVYALWGDAQAINVGDAMFTQGRRALLRLPETGVSASVTLSAVEALDAACLALCEGQYLDMDFESRATVSEAEYYDMVRRKTGALLACSTQLGALVATGDTALAGKYWRFGEALGLAFQVQDDILGIWGDPAVTGKPAADDIISRKKTLPVIYARQQARGEDAETLNRHYVGGAGPTPTIAEVTAAIARAGARDYADAAARRWCEAALAALADASPAEPAGGTLRATVESLLGRQT
jgi:geranylgeranyl diphosphate synthase, type I